MALDFSGKRVVVCGGSRGIGRAIAHGFAAGGAAVSICARGAAGLEATRAELAGHGRKTHAAPCDLADGGAISAYIAAAAAALGGIDILVNNVGAGDPDRFGLGGFLDVGDEQWRELFALNLFSAVWMSRAALPSLLGRREPSTPDRPAGTWM